MIKIKKLTKYYGQQCILDNLSLTIKKPKIIALIAPNGTGKTTLLNILMNLEEPDYGEISILGKSNKDVSIFNRVTYLQDNSILYSDLTGMDHLNFIANVHKIPKKKVQEIMKKLKINNYMLKKVKHYSLGMKQQLLFAMAILPDPKIILLDEPLNGLDPSSILRVRSILKELHQNGSTVILSSHNLEEIDKLTKNIYFLNKGKLLSIYKIPNQRNEYTYIVDQLEKVISYVQKNHLIFEKLTHNKIHISLTNEEKQHFDYFLKTMAIETYDWIINSKSTERIYFDLFRGDSDDIS